MSTHKIITENGKTFQLNLATCGVKVKSKNDTWYYTNRFGPKVYTEKQKCTQQPKKRKADSTRGKENTSKKKYAKQKKSTKKTTRKVDKKVKAKKSNVTDESKLLKQLENFIKTADECEDYKDFLETLDTCFNKYIVPVLKNHEQNNTLFHEKRVTKEVLNYMDKLSDCVMTRKTKCKITSDSGFFEHLDLDLHDLTSKYIDDARSRISK
jgi:hypothetical protein